MQRLSPYSQSVDPISSKGPSKRWVGKLREHATHETVGKSNQSVVGDPTQDPYALSVGIQQLQREG
jgi:hypothetical protein